MARACASAVIEAPVEAVWAAVRDFGALASWVPGLLDCAIEDGRDPDSIGCVAFSTLSGQLAKAR